MFRPDMNALFGERVAQMMVDAKEADPEKAKKEVRFHPDMPQDVEDGLDHSSAGCMYKVLHFVLGAILT